jgi:hypothetical protein
MVPPTERTAAIETKQTRIIKIRYSAKAWPDWFRAGSVSVLRAIKDLSDVMALTTRKKWARVLR